MRKFFLFGVYFKRYLNIFNYERTYSHDEKCEQVELNCNKRGLNLI